MPTTDEIDEARAWLRQCQAQPSEVERFVPFRLPPALESFAQAPGRRSRCLLGPPGTGKTWAAMQILVSSRDRLLTETNHHAPARFVNAVLLAADLRSDLDAADAKVDRLGKIPLLVIDDLARERSTPFIQDQMVTLLTKRHWFGLPTIITSNVAKIEDLAESLSSSLCSRLAEGGGVIEVSGPDRRNLTP